MFVVIEEFFHKNFLKSLPNIDEGNDCKSLLTTQIRQQTYQKLNTATMADISANKKICHSYCQKRSH